MRKPQPGTTTYSVAEVVFVRRLVVRLTSTFRAVLIPGLLLQGVAFAIVCGWYFVPPLRGAYDAIAAVRESGGLLFSALVFALAGGVIPVLLQAMRGNRPWASIVPDGSYLSCGWMLVGLGNDLLYHLQKTLFGAGADLPTLLIKTGFDQFVWTPVVAIPYFRLLYGLLEHRYLFTIDLLPVRAQWFEQAAPNLVANWVVWIPTVILIYAMPPPLQIPFAAVMVCFYSLLMLALGERSR